MINEIKTVRVRPRELEAVQFTGDNFEWLKEWVQGKLSFHKVTATADRLYLPTAEGVDILEPTAWVLYDPIDNSFRGATHIAMLEHFVEVGADGVTATFGAPDDIEEGIQELLDEINAPEEEE